MRSHVVFVSTLLCLMAELFVPQGECSNVQPKQKLWRAAKVSGFEWKSCSKPNAPVFLESLSVSPDPVHIPGTVSASVSGTTTVELAAPLAVNLTLEKEVIDFWVKIPCLDHMGSCHYTDFCELINLLIPPGEDCPEPFHTYGLPCHCPFKAGTYTLPKSDFALPKLDLPGWLSNGNYRVQGTLGSHGKELLCVKVEIAIHSDGW